MLRFDLIVYVRKQPRAGLVEDMPQQDLGVESVYAITRGLQELANRSCGQSGALGELAQLLCLVFGDQWLDDTF